jgi:hypothetical protein
MDGTCRLNVIKMHANILVGTPEEENYLEDSSVGGV